MVVPGSRIVAVSAADSDASDTIRKAASMTPNAAVAPSPTGQEIASNTPSPVAADLPPVKFSQIERPCPSRTARPARQTAQGTQLCGSQACGSSALGGAIDGKVASQG